MKTRSQKLAELTANPDDRRHGTYGYRLGCRCEKCKEAANEYFSNYRELRRMRLVSYKKPSKPVMDEKRVQANEKPKRHLRTAKNASDVCTVNEYDKALMGKPSVTADYCLVCGRVSPLEQHHVVFRSAGKWVREGVEVRKPTLTLCGFGNNLFDDHGRMLCHGAAHHRLLHFRYVPTQDGCGHWEYLFTEEPTKYETALTLEGWRRVGGREND